MKGYLELVSDLLTLGDEAPDRSGVGTTSFFGESIRHDMSEGFPLMTHKRMSLKSIAAELVWFCSGSTDNAILRDLGATIWDEWETPDSSELGPIYGRQWRAYGSDKPYKLGDWSYPDQLAQVLWGIVNTPESRRLIVNAWNPNQLEEMALPPCHFAFQFKVSYAKELSLQWYQRSCDVMLGLPYNIASYGLLLSIFAEITKTQAKKLSGSLGDTHIYLNHIKEGNVAEALKRPTYPLPRLLLDSSYFSPVEDLSTVAGCKKLLDRLFIIQAKETVSKIVSALEGYQHGPTLKMDVVV